MVLFTHTYSGTGMGGWSRVAWPDGKPTLEQPALAIDALSLVMTSYLAEMERNSKNV